MRASIVGLSTNKNVSIAIDSLKVRGHLEKPMAQMAARTSGESAGFSSASQPDLFGYTLTSFTVRTSFPVLCVAAIASLARQLHCVGALHTRFSSCPSPPPTLQCRDRFLFMYCFLWRRGSRAGSCPSLPISFPSTLLLALCFPPCGPLLLLLSFLCCAGTSHRVAVDVHVAASEVVVTTVVA